MDQRELYLKQLEEKWEHLTITNDIMFGMVMENEQICLELIQRSLPELNIKAISRITPQKQITGPISVRTVRFDVFVRDEEQRTFVVEMQVADKHNLPFRLRYYQQQIDFDILNVGDDYTKLAQYPTYIIMFCDFDYFGRGWSKYQFENRCINDPKLKLGDQRQITIFNAKASQFHGNMKLKGFLKLMGNQIDTSDQLVKQVRTEMKRIREDPIRRHGFMKYELDLMDARREGKEEAQKEAQVKAVTMLKDLGLEQEKIISELAKTYNMSHDEALKLIQKVR
ncbi:Rpn family recombination-promoting nuclease/putative transposase [Limosilactobacillus vaginalis]|uniref:Rpn family recombination-promoting nuclease/putative transposase n=2 Tax=Limosilactobacillus vaginalis TaxID=1633 RepID=A0AAW5WUX3_9LACO|nr:Rpn family recombination-promoting nuclease/putative transposase [Limosilactobacillus vaginalis]MCZ3668105.1 Rpn family recombination-promoting nuclease/putative transposase [Limosilactobacillus vaginalis]